MPQCRITADQDELFEHRTRARLLQQPEHAFDSDIHDGFGGFLARSEVEDVRDAGEGLGHRGAIRDGAADDFQPGLRGEFAVMTQRAHGEGGETWICQQAREEGLADFAGCAGDEDAGRSGGRHQLKNGFLAAAIMRQQKTCAACAASASFAATSLSLGNSSRR